MQTRQKSSIDGDSPLAFVKYLSRMFSAQSSETLPVYQFDGSQVALDFSHSSMPYYGQTGTFVVTMLQNGSPIGSSTFNWVRSGTTLVPAQPATLTAFVQAYPQATDASISLPDPGFVEAQGNNTAVAESYYGGQFFAGASGSHYRTSTGGGGVPTKQ